MITLDKICKIKAGDQNAAVDLLYDNMDYVKYLSKQLGVDRQYYDDFKQIAFLAVIDTAKVYSIAYAEKQTFKVLWKRYVMQHYLDFRLSQCYAVRVSRSTYTKLRKTVGIENSKLVQENIAYAHMILNPDIHFNVETIVLNKLLWQEVEFVLSVEEFEMIYLFYRLEYHMDYISRKMGLSIGEARKLKNRAIQKLRKSFYIEMLAKEYYGLKE